MASIKVVTYNILSQAFCNSKAYPEPLYQKDWIDKRKKYKRIEARLDEFIKENCVICLQEVDTPTSCDLHLFFQKRGYTFIFHNYGNWYDGDMGVAIAVPSSFSSSTNSISGNTNGSSSSGSGGIYTIQNIDKFRISSGKQWPSPRSYWGDWVNYLSVGYIQNLSWIGEDYNTWINARNKRNFMLSVRIIVNPINDGNGIVNIDKQKTICISTLHMPCAYQYPSIMLTYLALAREHAQKFAGKDEHILAGDFNIAASGDMYRALTDNTFDISHIKKDYPISDTWDPNMLGLKKLRSACYEHSANSSLISIGCIVAKNGREPDYTVNTQNMAHGDGLVFRDTLDYILISKGIKVKYAVVYYVIEEKIMPNYIEGSDHLPVIAELIF